MEKIKGRILKGIGGFYYIETELGIIECRARGSFRNSQMSPYVGDYVTAEFDREKMCGMVIEISERKNSLIRPAVSNIDRLYIVCSTTLPEPNLLNIDKLTAIAVHSEVEPIIVISKTDLDSAQKLSDVYKKTGITVFQTNAETMEGAEEIRKSLSGLTSVFTGNSGVGKSTLINQMFPELSLKTGEISQKLSRGRHTTRHIELFPLPEGGYIADTPGFSTIDFEGYAVIKKDEVAGCFPEFEPFSGNCRFPDCSHVGERDCSVKTAVLRGDIPPSRYESYCELFREAEKIRDWDIKQKR
ncbi:MAG: ribosome small subunit-dependent GTPase A [Oscillospiraceae bacterium]|nr:ribosome small subunit-dependent GTPase A [Oscillospiraceae bacterium]